MLIFIGALLVSAAVYKLATYVMNKTYATKSA